MLIVGFAILIAIGAVVLALPISSADGAWTDPLVALFTATSAVCVTGLIVVDTGTYWSGFGHVWIAILMQIGGFGFMTGSTLLLFLLVGRRTGLRDRVLVQATTDTPNLGQVTTLVRRVAAFTLVVEVAGALVLTVAFAFRGLDPLRAAWWGVFHSISGFNNAGFDLVGEYRSLAPYVDDPLVLAPMGFLIVVGGLGFAIIGDAVAKRRWSRWALETKLVLPTTLALIAIGSLAIAWFDWDNPHTLGALPVEQRPLNALFEAITLRTAGFSTLPTGSLAEPSLLVVMALMFIGGASGSTTGGIKVNTFAILLVATVSTARGLPSAVAFGRRIAHALVYRALSIALLGIGVVFLVGLGLQALGAGGFTFVEGLFEAVSAVGTVGASTGITRELSDPARLLVTVAMFVGRLGPLTLVVALTARARRVSYRPAAETVRIG